MGFLRRIADLFDPPAEMRAVDPSWSALAGGGLDWTVLKSGLPLGTHPSNVSRFAENFSTAQTCINVIAQSTASLPALMFRKEGGARELDEDHPVSALIQNGPNRWQTWPEYIEWLVAQALIYGNSLSEIVFDRNGDVKELRPIQWPHVTPRKLNNDRLVYDVSEHSGLGGLSRSRRLLDDECLILHDRSDDGLVGRSRLARSAPAIRLALTQLAFQENVFENWGLPGGFIEFPNNFKTPDDRKKFLEAWREGSTGVPTAGRWRLAEYGAKVKQSELLSPESMEALGARKFSREEIANIFNVPLPIAGIWDHASFTNSVEANKWFANYTLAPWTGKIEAAFQRWVFSAETRRTHKLKLDLSAFLRGDAETRWNCYDIAVDRNVLTQNEIRAEEGYDPRPELDTGPQPPDGDGEN